MQSRLIEEGVSARQFLFVTDIFRMLKDYREKARLKGWSLLPVALFALATAATFMFLFAFIIRLQMIGK